MKQSRSRPSGIIALTVFFVFGAAMSGLTLFLLLFPGTAVDTVWRLNPRAHDSFAAMGWLAMLLMVVVCAACATAAVGLWRCMRWGYWTATTILGVNLAGDTVNALVAHDWRTLVGLPIGGGMLAFLISKRRVFRSP